MIKITSTNEIQDHKIVKYLGLINANIVIGANFIADWFASWTDVVGGYSNSYENRLDEIYNKALNELKLKATQEGADALLGVHFDFDEVSGKGKSMFMVTAYGTAVKIAPIEIEKKKDDRYDIYHKLYNLYKFKEAGIITSEQYDAEKENIMWNYEKEIKKEIENIKSENDHKEAIKQAQILQKQLEEKKRREAEALMTEKEKLVEIRKAKETDIKNAIEQFKIKAPSIFNKVKELLDLNIKSPQNVLDNLSYNEIMKANYEDMNITPSDKMVYTIGRFIKEDKLAAACKYYIDIVNDDDIKEAKSYICSVYDIITFKKQSAFEAMAVNLVELKCLDRIEEAINEFTKYSVCDRETAKLVIDLL